MTVIAVTIIIMVLVTTILCHVNNTFLIMLVRLMLPLQTRSLLLGSTCM